MKKIVRVVRPNQQEHLDYPTMTLDQIKSIPVSSFADLSGCHVYLWTTHRFLPDAFDVFGAWGVKYQCLLTWVKNVGFTPYSFMYSTEFVLFGRFGSLPLLKLGKRTDFNAKVTKHSEKPDAFYELVDVVSPDPKLDMFARKPRDGWSVWGNEVQSDIDLLVKDGTH